MSRRLISYMADISEAARANVPDIRHIFDTLVRLGLTIEGLCFLWTTIPATKKPAKTVGWAPVFYLADHTIAFIAGTWFDPAIRNTKTHAPSIVARLLQVYAEGFAPEMIIAAPGFNADYEKTIRKLGFRPLKPEEAALLPDYLQDIGRASRANCTLSVTGLYCLDRDELPRAAARFEAYLTRRVSGYWIGEHYCLDVELHHEHFLARNWKPMKALWLSDQPTDDQQDEQVSGS